MYAICVNLVPIICCWCEICQQCNYVFLCIETRFDCDWFREGSLCVVYWAQPSPWAKSFLVTMMASITCTLRLRMARGSSQWARGPQTFGSSLDWSVNIMQCNNIGNWLIAHRKMEHSSVCWQSFTCVVHVSLVVCASLPYYDLYFILQTCKLYCRCTVRLE